VDAALLESFGLDPDVLHLNHGAFGVSPVAVRRAAAAWLDPSLITRERYVWMDVSVDKGMSYGDTLVWTDHDKPSISLQKAHVQMDVDWPKFQKMFVQLMSAPTPNAHDPQMHQANGEGKQ